jgi:hypothetical protein
MVTRTTRRCLSESFTNALSTIVNRNFGSLSQTLEIQMSMHLRTFCSCQRLPDTRDYIHRPKEFSEMTCCPETTAQADGWV